MNHGLYNIYFKKGKQHTCPKSFVGPLPLFVHIYTYIFSTFFSLLFIFLISNSLANESPNIKNVIINKELKTYDNIAFLDVNEKMIKLSFITIYGDTPETLVFYIGDGRSKKETTKTFSFKNNNVLGTIAKPVVLEILSDNVSVFPNPFENNLTVKVDVIESQVVTIQLYNLTSQLLYSKKFEVKIGSNLLEISPKVATGTYLLQVKMTEGSVISKVVKK